MNKCAVIMSTFNGEKFLKMQVDSILQQEDVSVDLYIRDDGSCDGTKKIINSYAHLSDRVHFLNPTEKINLGYKRSFIHALKTVVDFSGGGV